MTLPRPNPLLQVTRDPVNRLVICRFRFDVFTGPTTAFAEWLLQTDIGAQSPTSITIAGDRIELLRGDWDASRIITLIDYTRGPIPYAGFDNRELQSFQEPVPFP